MASPAVDFYIRKGDASPALVLTPQTAAGTTAPVSGSPGITIVNADTGVSHTPTGATDIFTDTDSVVKLRYTWGASETASMAAGYYRAYLSDGTPESFPNNAEILIQVYDGPVGQILTSRADYDSVISTLGVTINDFSYTDVESIGFLQSAEAKITDTLLAQPGYNTTIPTVAKIMAGTSPATPLDKTHLKAAVVYQLAYLFGPGETNSVDVSQSVGPVSRDLGGIGETWRNQMEEYQIQCDYHIGKITGFKRWRVLT